MKKITTLLLLSGCLLASTTLMSQQTVTPAFHSTQIQWLKNYSDATAKAQSEKKPIAILFTGSGWCPACVKLEREVIANSEFNQSVGQKFVFLKAEFPDYSESAIMASPYKQLMDRYGVTAFPTIVVIDANGQQLYTVHYKQGGAQIYAHELLKGLSK